MGAAVARLAWENCTIARLHDLFGLRCTVLRCALKGWAEAHARVVKSIYTRIPGVMLGISGLELALSARDGFGAGDEDDEAALLLPATGLIDTALISRRCAHSPSFPGRLETRILR